MMTGDFVQLPTMQAGQELAVVLFGHLDANGNPSQTYYIDPAANDDGCQHAVAFFPTDSRYIIVGLREYRRPRRRRLQRHDHRDRHRPVQCRLLKNTAKTLPK